MLPLHFQLGVEYILPSFWYFFSTRRISEPQNSQTRESCMSSWSLHHCSTWSSVASSMSPRDNPSQHLTPQFNPRQWGYFRASGDKRASLIGVENLTMGELHFIEFRNEKFTILFLQESIISLLKNFFKKIFFEIRGGGKRPLGGGTSK